MIGTQKPEHFATRTFEMVLQHNFCYPSTRTRFHEKTGTQFDFRLGNVWPIGPFHNVLLLFFSDVLFLLRAEPAD